MKRTLLLPTLVMAFACGGGPEGTRDKDCEDGKDNDQNGFVDCEDNGCNENLRCKEIAAKAKEAEAEAEAARKKAEEEAAKKAAAEASRPVIELESLMIQRGHNGEDVDFNEAKAFCERLKLEDFDDWRLPTREEAVRVAKSKKLAPEAYVMWTSTLKGKKRGVIVGITSGAANDLGVRYDGDCRARCVRDF